MRSSTHLRLHSVSRPRSTGKIRVAFSGLTGASSDSLITSTSTTITSIAIPPLGCGLGGLDWNKVKPLIEQHLSGVESSRPGL